ncbi:hypothetical protein GQ44DRAFT_777610 [Phaeosphaeriaceae sp. PMI808]|nr:hypothetical protein GQ44DRAFT_777610 [Phaeosphaeriaceae sp. PMI808]
MSTQNISPDRVARNFVTRWSSTASAAKPESLPPDVEAAYKRRINEDLVHLFKIPCPAETTASIQGIGLYTHIAPPPTPAPLFPHQKYTKKTADPVFLPTGGLKRVPQARGSLVMQTSPEMKKVFKEVQQAVNGEEKHIGQRTINMDQLRERYETLDAPNPHTARTPGQMHDGTMLGMDESDDIIQQPGGHRSSVGTDRARDVIMGGVDQEKRPIANAKRFGNTYEAARDPRIRG